MMKRAVLLGAAAHGFRDSILSNLSTEWEVRQVKDDDAEGRLTDADAIVTNTFDDRHRGASRVKMIQVPGAGYDGIRWEAVPRGVCVCNVFEHEGGCAEYVMLGMLEWSIRLNTADAELRAGNWSRSSRFCGMPSSELRSKTLGIVGLGRIGREIARRARAFDMIVNAVNRSPLDPMPEVDRVSALTELSTLAAEADFLVICCALTPETHGLINDKILATMKKSAVIINVARGPVVDEEALWSALSAGAIGGAILDVWWINPPDLTAPMAPSRFPFERLDNIIISPHIAGWTTGTLIRRGRFIAANLDRLARGEKPLNIIGVK
jgi:phosphoglycerate dehydrogenase-like enzyme